MNDEIIRYQLRLEVILWFHGLIIYQDDMAVFYTFLGKTEVEVQIWESQVLLLFVTEYLMCSLIRLYLFLYISVIYKKFDKICDKLDDLFHFSTLLNSQS